MTFGPITRRCALAGGIGLAAATAVAPALARAARNANFDWRLHRPEEVGMSQAGLQGIRAAVQKHIDNHAIPGAVTVVSRHNKLVWYEAQGVRNVETQEPMRKDDLFRMMSSTKPVTAVAVLMMLESGRLSLDDKVSRFIPSFANPRVAIPPDDWQ